jgi:RNA polymerase sigma factor (sigma-70 family)
MSVPVPAADGSTPDSGGAPIPQPGIARPGVPAEDEVATIPISSSVRQSTPPPVPDSDLLAAFVDRKDQAAFTAIVERYSALVYRVALRSLNDRHLADDVFQATFLVLAQSARRIKNGDLLAAWLHGTARNLARRALTHKQSQRNQLAISTSLTRSQKGGEMSTPAELDPLDQLVRRHEQQLLDEELQNLPESSRAPLVLYYLEEKSQAEIAQLMGLTVDAVEGRLRRAKHDLRLRLIRRGVTLSGVVAAATLLTPSLAAAAPTPALISTTISVALGTAAGTSLAAASTTAATLATKEVTDMSLASKAAAFVFGTAGVLTVSAGLIFGAVVTSMGREGAEGHAAARALAERSVESEEISTELALVDEVPAELTQATSPPVEQASSDDQPKATVYQLSDLLLEQRDQIQEFAKGLGVESSWIRTTQSLVIRANSKAHQKIAEEISEMRKQVLGAEAEVLKLKKELSERQSVLAKDHPDVQQLEDKIQQSQLSLNARDLLREKDNEIIKWQKMYREEQIEKEMQRDQVARREKANAELTEKLNAVTSGEALPQMVAPGLNWAEKMFSSLNHDFGDVASGSVHQHVIEITNRYKETVTLTAPVSYCGRCVTLELDRTVLQSKEVAHLTITLDTKGFRGQRNLAISMDASFEPKNFKQVRIPVTANILAPESGEVDARISHVDSKNRAVWLDIGRQQNLQPQITFSVYDKSQSGLAPGIEKVKARIEVMEVRDNSSIARIVEEIQPIEVGDVVHSPAWNAREPEHFALSGNIDLNGDGEVNSQDRKILSNLLTRNGAMIDVEITSEGFREPADGKLTNQTKWLVVGELSKGQAMPMQHLQLVEEAREQGIRIVALKDFLTYMGWKPNYRVYLPTPDKDGVIRINSRLTSLHLMLGHSQVLKFPARIQTTEKFAAEIVEVTPSQPEELLVRGTKLGTTTMVVEDENHEIYSVELNVRSEPARVAPATLVAPEETKSVTVLYPAADLSLEQRSDFLDYAQGEKLNLVYQSEKESFQVTTTPFMQSRVDAFLKKSRDDARLIDSLKQSLDQQQWKQIHQQLDTQFEVDIQRLMVSFKAATRDELEIQLRHQGTSLNRMRRLFRQHQLLRHATRKGEGENNSLVTNPHEEPWAPEPIVGQGQRETAKSQPAAPSVPRTTTITHPETDLTIQPHEIAILKFLGPVVRAEVQYDRAVHVTTLAVKSDHLHVRGTAPGNCELTATLQHGTVHRVRFQVGTTPANRFRDLNCSEAKIRRALDQQVSLEFPDNTLKEVCEYITQLNDIEVQLSGNELTAAGIDVDSKVSLVVSGITLRSALKLMLEGLKLDYCIDNDRLIITTPAEVKNRKRLEYYHLSSLSSDSQSTAEKFIAPLADSVSNLQGDLLVDASLDVHRQLEEFLDKAYKLEIQEPARPVELAKTLLAAPMAPTGASQEVSELSPELAKILTQWRTKSEMYHKFSCSFKSMEYDSVFGTETRSLGQLRFERPDSGRIDIGPADAGWLQKPGRMTKEGTPYKIVSGAASTWLSTATSVYVLNMKDQTYDIFDIPPALQGKYLDTLPPHWQFGMQPPPLDGSYKFELGRLHNPDGSKHDSDGQAMPKAIHVVAVCQKPQAMKPFKFLGMEWPILRNSPDTLEYLLDPDTYVPLNVRTHDSGGNHETVYSFDHSSMKVNAGFGPLKASPFQQPDLAGWKLMHHIKDEPAPAQELPISAKPQNERIALSICMFETTAATVEGLTVESSGKRFPKEGFRKLLDEAVKSKQARTIYDQAMINRLGKPFTFFSGGEHLVPVDGDQTKTSNYRLKSGIQFTLTPHRRSSEELIVEISGEISNLRSRENNNKEINLPTVQGQVIRSIVTIPGSTHQAIVGPIWKSERTNSSGETEKVGIYLRIHEEAITGYDSPVEVLTEPAAPTLIPPDPKTTDDAQPETIARVIDLAEMPQTTPSEVAEALKLLVEPESWKGTCDIKPLGKSIVVRNRSEVVEQCLKSIDEMIASEKKRVAEEQEKAAKGPSL